LTKLLADENIPRKTVQSLTQKGIDIISVTDTSPGMSDRSVLELGNNEDRVIVTFDKDFGELIFRQRLDTKGLILLRITPVSPEQIAEKIEQTLTRQTTIKNTVIVVREDRIRVTPIRK